jgi:hypothetical protein
MAKRGRLAIMVVLCWLLAIGCSTLDLGGFLTLSGAADGNERTIAGSLDAVAKSTQSGLTQMGFQASLARNGETIRIASMTATGKKFTLVLKAVKGPNGEETTKVRVEWDGEGDQQTSLQLLSQVESAAKRQ